MRIAVLASHEGTTLQAIIDAYAYTKIDSRVAVVISNNSKSGALQRAKRQRINAYHVSSKTHDDPDEAIRDILVQHDIDIVISAGYMKKIGPKVLASFEGRIYNTHPSLLPKYGGQAFYGRRIYEAVIAAGETETGVTFHKVDGGYDTGEIVSQVRINIRSGETAEQLEERVKRFEKILIVGFIGLIE